MRVSILGKDPCNEPCLGYFDFSFSFQDVRKQISPFERQHCHLLLQMSVWYIQPHARQQCSPRRRIRSTGRCIIASGTYCGIIDFSWMMFWTSLSDIMPLLFVHGLLCLPMYWDHALGKICVTGTYEILASDFVTCSKLRN